MITHLDIISAGISGAAKILNNISCERRSCAMQIRDEEFAATCVDALKTLDAAYIDLMSQLRERDLFDPSRVVANRYSHLIDMAVEVPFHSEWYGFSPHETLLASLCCFAHDGGRFREALLNVDTLEQGEIRLHSLLSVQLIEETGALNKLSSEYSAAIRSAVLWHAERKIDPHALPVESLAGRLCAALRDSDISDILREYNDYVLPERAFDQASRHFLPKWIANWNEIVKDSVAVSQVIEIFSRELLNKNDRGKTYLEEPNLFLNAAKPIKINTQKQPSELEEIIVRYINAPIHPASLDDFLNYEPLNMREAWRSASTYWLAQLGTIFNVKAEALKADLIRGPSFRERLNLIRPRVGTYTANLIEKTYLTIKH